MNSSWLNFLANNPKVCCLVKKAICSPSSKTRFRTRSRESHSLSCAAAMPYDQHSCRRIETKINADVGHCLVLIKFTHFTTKFNISCSSGDNFFAARASLWRKQWVHLVFGAFFWIRFTTPELKRVHVAVPSVRITAQLSHGIEYSEKKLLRHWKISLPFVCNFNALQNKKSSDIVALLM